MTKKITRGGKTKKLKQWYCFKCGAKIPQDKINDNHKGKCPACKRYVEFVDYYPTLENTQKAQKIEITKEETIEEGKKLRKKRKKRPRFCFIESHDNGDEWNEHFRTAVACELINCNYTNNEIIEFFKTHDENSGELHDPQITLDNVERIRRKKMHSWGCKKLNQKCAIIVNKYCDSCPKNKEEDTALYVSTFELPDEKYLEETIIDGNEKFILYDKKTDTWEIINDYCFGDTLIKPYPIDINQRNAVVFPDGVEEYDTLQNLIDEMVDFALEEYDPVDYPELYELTIYLTLASWVSPVWQKNTAEKFIPILNARGPSETGKKRFLTVMRYLTYHSLYGLKTIRVPTLFRGVGPIEGTLILDEADMNDSSLSSELVEFLNSRADGVPIPRYSLDLKKVEYWKSFGMTIMATRSGFKDDGLESRCTVMPTATTDYPENYHLIPPDEWLEKGKTLQRKLLLFKLRHLDGKMPTQLTIPDVSSFRVREALLIIEGLKDEEPALLQKAKKLALILQERIIKERAASPEGLVLNVVYGNLTDGGTQLERNGLEYIIVTEWKKEDKVIRTPLTLKTVSKSLGETFSPSDIAKMWRGLNQETLSQKKFDGRRYRGVLKIKNIVRLDKIFPKYIPDYEQPVIFEIEMKAKQTSLGEGD